MTAREVSRQNACAENLQRIDAAKQEWAIRRKDASQGGVTGEAGWLWRSMLERPARGQRTMGVRAEGVEARR